jgi:hypothetical protein
VLSVEFGDAESVAPIRYSGDNDEVTIRSRWQEQDGRRVIVAAEPRNPEHDRTLFKERCHGVQEQLCARTSGRTRWGRSGINFRYELQTVR